jgi:hypothetical protein
LASAVAVAAVVVGCSDTAIAPPTEDVAKAGYAQMWLDEDLQRLVSFKKTQGTMGRNNDVKTYELQFQAEFVCLKEWTIRHAMRVFQCEPGKKIAHAGSLEFELTENGWQAR